ncbi:molybdenum cofactor biosynthesis protein A [Thiorhodovibrio litoralis]|nr:molybdenum cofactor biosynthesis protein A [Thiorhodovibrio litoralis]
MNMQISSLPTSVHLELTNTCNLQCKFCCVGEFGKGEGQSLEWYLGQFEVYTSPELVNIRLVGAGEPTVYRRFRDLVRELIARGFNMSLVTNGVRLLNFCEHLVNFEWICVSVHGLGPVHNQLVGANVFDRVISGIKALQDAKPDVNMFVSCVVCSENISSMLQIADFFAEQNVPLRFAPLVDNSLLSKSDKLLLREQLRLINLYHPEVKLPPYSEEPAFEESVRAFIADDQELARQGLDADRVVCKNIYREVKINHKGNLFFCKYRLLGNLSMNSLRHLWESEGRTKFLVEIEKHVQATGYYPQSCLKCCYLTNL